MNTKRLPEDKKKWKNEVHGGDEEDQSYDKICLGLGYYMTDWLFLKYPFLSDFV